MKRTIGRKNLGKRRSATVDETTMAGYLHNIVFLKFVKQLLRILQKALPARVLPTAKPAHLMCDSRTSTDRCQLSAPMKVPGICRVHFAGTAFAPCRQHQGSPIPSEPLSMSVTNEGCPTSGLYLASGACGHAGYQRVTKGQPFPTCRACGKAINWTFLRETYSPNPFGDTKNQEEEHEGQTVRHSAR